MTRRHRQIRPRATCLSDAEILAVLLQLLARTGRLELGEMVAAVAEAEREKVRSRLRIISHVFSAAQSCAPSGVA